MSHVLQSCRRHGERSKVGEEGEEGGVGGGGNSPPFQEKQKQVPSTLD